MNLEDHAGDLIRKARSMAGVPVGAAATATGLDVANYRVLEREGKISAGTNLRAVARLVGLDADKLERLARGWRPAPVELAQWSSLRCITTADADMSVNCFLVWDEATRAAALFDTGFDAAPVLAMIERERLRLEHIFITHGHSDHVEGLVTLRGKFSGARVHWNGANAAGSRNQPGEAVSVGRLSVTHRLTPGHAEDGVTYVIHGWPNPAPAVAVVGDALFAGSVGLSPAGWEVARTAIAKEILSLPSATLICPGHGPLTTVGEELGNNPFF